MDVTRLYLPLLAHAQPAVRRQACMLLLGTYGDRALTYLRRLLDDPDPQVRQDARLALLSVRELTDKDIQLAPFRGMYVECLGRLSVYIGSRTLRATDWSQAEGGRAGYQKVQGVLAYLVHCGRRGVSRAALGAAVWGGAHSPSSLARTLSTLRQAFAAEPHGALIAERALTIEADYCRLDPEFYHTDVQLFEQAYSLAVQTEHDHGLAQAAPLYRQVLRLYAGPYMADVPRGSGWSQQRRDYLLGSFVLAAERCAEQLYSAQQYHECLAVCTPALEADPRADEVVVWLLRACAALGLHADLEHAYRGYLRAAQLGTGVDERDDPVAQTYHALARQVGG